MQSVSPRRKLTAWSAETWSPVIKASISQHVFWSQRRPAEACGMSRVTVYRRIVLPRAFQIAWPAYGNEVILLLKGSALVSTITVYDLMGETRSVFSRGYDDTVYLYAAALYLFMALAITGTFRLGERRMNRYLRASA